MAENDVFIEGGNWPAWATEGTQTQILNALLAAGVSGLKKGDLQKLIDAVSSGDTDIAQILKSIKAEDRDNTKTLADTFAEANKKIDQLRETNERSETERNKDSDSLQSSIEKSFGNFSELMANIRDGLEAKELDVAQLKEGMSESFADSAGELGDQVVNALGALAAFANGANQYAIQLGEDRFNLVNEIRQSGLANTLNTLDGSLLGFSEMVNRSSFTLGQAAKFTEQFSRSVGGVGIERSLAFVQEMAYEMSNSGMEGADMMRRFGLEFGGVAEVAGNYLDTVRNLGMLDRMNNQQLRSGMEDFMDTVTVTSNVLKVGITEAAEMIAGTLAQRDDLTTLLAGLPDQMRDRVQNVVAAFGAQNTQFGESIAFALSSRSFDEFRTTEQGQALAGSNFGNEFLPILEEMFNRVNSGQSTGDVIAGMSGPIDRLVDRLGDEDFRALAVQNEDPMIRQLAADMLRIRDTIGDANDGNAADTRVTGREDSAEFMALFNNRQQAQLTTEDIENSLAKVFNYADNLGELNRVNAGLIESIQNTVSPAVEAFGGETLFDVTTFVDTTLRSAVEIFVDIVGEAGSLISNKFEQLREEEQRQQAAFREQAGISEQDNIDREERIRIEREVGNAGDDTRNFLMRMFTSDATRESFDIDKIAEAIARGNEVVDYEYVDKDRNSPTFGETITEKRISTDEGMFDAASYMEIEPNQLAVVQSLIERQARFENFSQSVLLDAGRNSEVSSSFASDLISILGENRDGSIDYTMLADELGIDERYSSSNEAELAFVRETLQEFANNNLTNVTEISNLVTALEGMTAQLEDRSWIAGGERVANRELGERDALLAELRVLIKALNGN